MEKKIEKVGENPFKIGDKVKLVTRKSDIYQSSEYYTTEDCLEIGGVYTVESLTSNNLSYPAFIYTKDGTYCHPHDCFIKMYTIEELRKIDMWIKCTSKEQGQKLGKYLWMDKRKSSLETFSFLNTPVFFVYLETYKSKEGGWVQTEGWIKNHPKEGTIDFEQVIFPDMEEEKVIGYKLIKMYPSSPELGYITTRKGEQHFVVDAVKNEYHYKEYFQKHSEYWEPIYQPKVKEENVIIGCDSGYSTFIVKVTSNKQMIFDEPNERNAEIDFDKLKLLLNNIGTINDMKAKWGVKVNYVDIGCKKQVSVRDLYKLEETYTKLNNIK